MKKLVCVFLGLVMAASLAMASPRKSGSPGGGRSAQHSNAPGTSDRDFGRDRAEDVGEGKKWGLKKHKHHKKEKKHKREKEDKKEDRKEDKK